MNKLTASLSAVQGLSATLSAGQGLSASLLGDRPIVIQSKYGISLNNVIGNVVNEELCKPQGGDVDLVVSGFTDVATYGLSYLFIYNQAVRTVEFADLERVDTANAMYSTFFNCDNLVTAEFPKLISVTGASGMFNLFNGCAKLESVDFPSLESVSGVSVMQTAFQNCPNLETLSFPTLKIIGAPTGNAVNYRQFYHAFVGCTKLTTLEFPALEHIYCNGANKDYGTFAGNTNLKKLYFPKLKTISKTTQYTVKNNLLGVNNLLTGCTALTEIHFAAENEETITASTGFKTKWGRSAATIYFDL